MFLEPEIVPLEFSDFFFHACFTGLGGQQISHEKITYQNIDGFVSIVFRRSNGFVTFHNPNLTQEAVFHGRIYFFWMR
jgi:hypothetical protein